MDGFIDTIEWIAAIFVACVVVLIFVGALLRYFFSASIPTLVLLFVVTVQTYTLFDKVVDTWRSNVLTFDLGLPTWPFFALAWVGDVCAVLLIAIRTWRLVFHPDEIHDETELKVAD
jgi:uncharacterized membrane protein YfcA